MQVSGQGPRRDVETRRAWRIELAASVPLHPQRWQWDIDSLVDGRFRSRGCFWALSRPQQVGVWEGAGGQLSIGALGPWGRARPFTRWLFTGLLEDDPRDRLEEVVADIVLTEAELRSRGTHWDVATNGLEPWLGRTSQVA